MGVRFFVSLVISALAGLFLPPPAFAQAAADAGVGKLEAVTITGSARFTSEQIRPATGLTPGATVTKEALQSAADRLAQLGPFARVQYRYGTEDAGVRAEYQVTDAPSVPIWFDNFPWFSDDELVAALKNAVPLFDGAAPEGGTLLNDISQELQGLLATRGVHATVSHTLTSAPGGDQRIQQFRVDDAAVNVASVQFSDALAQSDRGIQARLMDIVGGAYSRTAVELFEIEQVRPVYLSHGFLRVKFGPPKARLTGGATDSRVAIDVTIEPGSTYAWTEPTWKGNSVLGVLELSTLVPLHDGDPADGMKIERGWQAVSDAYARHGYLSAALDPQPHFDDRAKRISYAVSITEGPQYHMGKLVLTGLSLDGERRIRAAWRIQPGEVFDKSVYDEFVANGIRQAFSGLPFHYEKIGRFLQEDASAGVVDVLLDFQ